MSKHLLVPACFPTRLPFGGSGRENRTHSTMPSTTNAETPQATTDAEQRPNVCLTVLHYLALVLPYLLQCLLLTTLSFKLLLLAIFLQLALLIMFVVERHLLMVSYRPLASRQLFMVQVLRTCSIRVLVLLYCTHLLHVGCTTGGGVVRMLGPLCPQVRRHGEADRRCLPRLARHCSR